MTATRRVRLTFWALVALATVGVGVLSRALADPPGARTALLVAASGLAVVVAGALALRILVVTSRGD